MTVSRRVRAAWIIGGSLFTIGTLALGTLQTVAALAHEERSVRTVIDDPIRVIDIEASGSITVLGSDVSSVTVDERVSDGLHRPDRSIRVQGDRLVLRGTCGEFPATFCNDNFVVRAPRSVRVIARGDGITVARVRGGADLTTYGDGITLRSVAGAMRLRSHGGGITARALGATNVDARSFGGNISIFFSSTPRDVNVSSLGGGIDVAVPENRVAYRVDTSTHGGATHTAIRTDPTSSNQIRASSFGGNITIRYTNG
jgi:hypothetical protein